MNTADITLIMTSLTAIAAVAVPAISTWIGVKSNERIKMAELQFPKAHEALGSFIAAYGNLSRSDHKDVLSPVATNARLREFMICGYRVLSFVPDIRTQDRICDFIAEMISSEKATCQETDTEFNAIISDVARCIGMKRLKKRKRIPRKAKLANSKQDCH